MKSNNIIFVLSKIDFPPLSAAKTYFGHHIINAC